ncbi:hypothetical protein Lal_00030110 [Lupinus albus]|nr:hypothetical protein Lal_00030110 [Lupinus albus]
MLSRQVLAQARDSRSSEGFSLKTYKHRTDHQPAPTDEPEPTIAPNQPESHAQSSASAAMPTNQMIMD